MLKLCRADHRKVTGKRGHPAHARHSCALGIIEALPHHRRGTDVARRLRRRARPRRPRNLLGADRRTRSKRFNSPLITNAIRKPRGCARFRVPGMALLRRAIRRNPQKTDRRECQAGTAFILQSYFAPVFRKISPFPRLLMPSNRTLPAKMRAEGNNGISRSGAMSSNVRNGVESGRCLVNFRKLLSGNDKPQSSTNFGSAYWYRSLRRPVDRRLLRNDWNLGWLWCGSICRHVCGRDTIAPLDRDGPRYRLV